MALCSSLSIMVICSSLYDLLWPSVPVCMTYYGPQDQSVLVIMALHSSLYELFYGVLYLYLKATIRDVISKLPCFFIFTFVFFSSRDLTLDRDQVLDRAMTMDMAQAPAQGIITGSIL